MSFLLRTSISLSLIYRLINGQGQLNFDFSEIVVITEEGVNTSTCDITYNYSNHATYFIAYSEFDEVDEETFEDRTFAVHIVNNTGQLSLANFTRMVPKYNPSGQQIGYLPRDHLPLYRKNINSPNEEYNTYNPSIAIGDKSSFVIFDSYHPDTDKIWIEYNDLNLNIFNSLEESTHFTYPNIKYAGTDLNNLDDIYILVYIINQNDMRVATIANDGINSPVFTSAGNWSSQSVIINNTQIQQFIAFNSSQWLIAYDISSNNDINTEIYGHPLYWELKNTNDQIADFDDIAVALTESGCRQNQECKKILQDIVPAINICTDNNYDAVFLIVYTVDKQMVMDLISFTRNTQSKQSVIDRIWSNSYYVLEENGDDVMIGDVQDVGLINLYHIDDPTPFNLTGMDYYIISYIDQDNIGKVRAFGISGCNASDPYFDFLGIPTELPSTEILNPFPPKQEYSTLCMAQSFEEEDIMVIAWYQFGDIDIVIDNNGENEIKFDEYWLYTSTLTWYWETRSPTMDPTHEPSANPTRTRNPTAIPTMDPTKIPSISPTKNPSISPTPKPTKKPTIKANVPSNPPTLIPTVSPITSKPTQSPTHPPVTDADASAAFTALTSSPLESPILIVITIVIAVLFAISILAWCHNFKASLFPCFWPTDDARVGALVIFALQVWDFSTDANFAWCLYAIYWQLKSGFILALMIVSTVCLIVPWILNIIYLLIQRWRWTRHSVVNAWIRDYAWFLIALCMVSGGANPAIQLCNSRIFGLLPFQMELPRYEYLKTSRWPLFFVTMFENIPQIIIQFAFVAHYSLETDNCNDYSDGSSDYNTCTSILQSTALASVSSIIAIIFAFGVCLLQCSDPLDDKRFILDVKLDDQENEKHVRLQLGMRRKISHCVAQAITMHDNIVTIEAVKFGYNRLKFVMSVTETVSHLKEKKNANPRRSTFIDKMGKALRNDQDEDLDEIHYDKLLHQLLTAKSNGMLAKSLKRALKLKYTPIVENIEIPEMNEMPDLDEVVENLKKNWKDENEVVIIASGSAKRAISYDDAQRIHQQSAKISKPSIIELQQEKNEKNEKNLNRQQSSIVADQNDIVLKQNHNIINMNDDIDAFPIPKIKSLNVEGGDEIIGDTAGNITPGIHDESSHSDKQQPAPPPPPHNNDNDNDDDDVDEELLGTINKTDIINALDPNEQQVVVQDDVDLDLIGTVNNTKM